MIDTIPLEEQLSLVEAAKLMRGRGRRPHPAVETLRRWANPNRGCVVGGQTLILGSVRIGGDIITCRKWVEEFERERLAVGMRQVKKIPPTRTERQRRKAHERAERNLDKAGIGERSP